jgi:hypothetical protein
MAATHGSKASFQVTDSGSTLRDITAFLSEAGLPRSADTAEVSTLSSLSKKYVPGLKDGTVPIAGPFDPTVDGYLQGILGMERTFEYYPAGTPVGATKPKYSGSLILTSYEVSTPVDDAATFTGEFQLTGDVARAVA